MTPQRRKSRRSKLMVHGKMVNQPEVLLDVWAQHFGKLAKLKVSDSGLQGLSCEMDKLASRSVSNEEFTLDVPFSAEEVATAVKKLKGRKAAGPDGLTAEHFKESGDVMVIWLVNILNAVVDLEVVPSTLKSVLMYKGGDRDPVLVDSYRGVTLSPVIAKVLGFLILMRPQPLLLEANIPRVNQSPYRKRVS